MLKGAVFCTMLAAALAVQCYDQCVKITTFKGTHNKETDFISHVPADQRKCNFDTAKICEVDEKCMKLTADLSGKFTELSTLHDLDLKFKVESSSCAPPSISPVVPQSVCNKLAEPYMIKSNGFLSSKFQFPADSYTIKATCAAEDACVKDCGVDANDLIKAPKQCHNPDHKITKFTLANKFTQLNGPEDSMDMLSAVDKSYSVDTITTCKADEECYTYVIDATAAVADIVISKGSPKTDGTGALTATAQQCLGKAIATAAETKTKICEAWQVGLTKSMAEDVNFKDNAVSDIKVTCQTPTRCGDACVDPDNILSAEQLKAKQAEKEKADKEKADKEKAEKEKSAAHTFGFSAILLVTVYFF